MNQDSIPEGATKLRMEYTIHREVTLPEGINREDISRWWVNWGALYIEMNDGTLHHIHPDGNEAEAMESVNWKRGHHNLSWVDDDYKEVPERVIRAEEVADGTYALNAKWTAEELAYTWATREHVEVTLRGQWIGSLFVWNCTTANPYIVIDSEMVHLHDLTEREVVSE